MILNVEALSRIVFSCWLHLTPNLDTPILSASGIVFSTEGQTTTLIFGCLDVLSPSPDVWSGAMHGVQFKVIIRGFTA